MIGRGWLFVSLCALLLWGSAQSASAEPPKKSRAAHGAKKQRAKRPKRSPSSGEPRRARGDSETRRAHAEPKREAGPDAPARRDETDTHAAAREQYPDSKRGERESAAASPQRAAQDAAQGANAEIVKEGDTSVKVMSFSGLDIEGRLKSPQLLYFVSRVHAEFDRPKLPHRSFMPELESSTEREPIR